MKQRFILLCAAVCLALPITGCQPATSTTPAQATAASYYSKAALVLNDFSGILLQSEKLFETAHTSGLVNDNDFANGRKAFATIATNGDAVTTLVRAGGSEASITLSINALILQIGQMPTAFGIKDPISQTQFTLLCTTMQNMLQSVITLVQPTTVVP